MSKSMPNKMIWLLVGLPAASVAMGLVTLMLAIVTAEGPTAIDEPPLSKTSWNDQP